MMHVNVVSLRDIIFRELELIKGLLTDRFPDLNPTLKSLPAILNDQAGGRRSTKRRRRK